MCLPDGIVSTGFPAVADMLEEMDYPLDGWQRGLAQSILAKREDGIYAAGIGGVAISIPRQCGKTYSIAGLVFAMCALQDDMFVLWTAHRARTHNETFRSMEGLAKSLNIAPYVRGIRKGAGQEAVEFTNGSRILFGARENGFGRGFQGVDMIIFDEAQILGERALDDMVPATNTAANPLIIMMGTPPKPNDPGDVFIDKRQAGLDGDPDTLYVEFSADRDADPDSKESWADANPSYPHRTRDNAMLRMRKQLGSTESFKREALGIWDENAKGLKAFDFKIWNQRFDEPPTGGRIVFGVKFSADGSHVALSGATKPDDPDAPIFVEAIESRLMSEGTQWLVDFIVDRKDNIAQVVVDGRSGVGYFTTALKAAGVRGPIVKVPTTEEAISAHTDFEQGIVQGTLSHSGQHVLGEQIKNTTRRKIGNSGGFGWAPIAEGEVTFVDSTTLAYWGAKNTKRKPGRGQRIL